MRIQNFLIFEASNLMWPQEHRCSLKKAFICTLLKFDIQPFLFFNPCYIKRHYLRKYSAKRYILLIH
jgi:hypothetical protein